MPPTGVQQLANWYGSQPAQQASGQAGTFLVPTPKINPVQVPPKRPPIDVLSQPGALAQARPPVMIGAPVPKPQITIQGPQPGPTPSQDTLLKSARGRELQVTGGMDLGPVTSAAPGPPMLPPAVIGPAATGNAGMSQADRDRLAEVRALQQQALLNPVSMAGHKVTTRSFTPLDPADLSRGGTFSEETTDNSPEALARKMAMANGGWGDWRDFLDQANVSAQQTMDKLLAQQTGAREWAEKGRRFELDQTTQLGRLQMENAKHQADLALQMQPLTPDGRKQLFINKHLADGKSPQETYALAEQAEKLGQFGAGGPPPGVGTDNFNQQTPPSRQPQQQPQQQEVDPALELARIDPVLAQELTTGGEGGKLKSPDQAWQHLFDRKGKEWIAANSGLIRRFFNKYHGADTMRDLRRAGFADRMLTGASDLVLAGAGLLPDFGLGGNPIGPNPEGRARFKDMVDQGLGERLDRFLGINRQRSEASALLRALTGGE